MLILRVWRDQPGRYFCISTKDRHSNWKDKFFKPSQFSQVKEYIHDNLDKDLYWCPHGFLKPRRLSDYSVPPHLLWADLDKASPTKMKPMPSIAWQSSPDRFQALWITDKPIPIDINRRLTYHVKADLGCWNFGRVLRIPGTCNYKYPSTPRVRMLWQDGPSHTLKALEHILPGSKDPGPDFGDAHSIYSRYQKRMTPFCRSELMTKKVPKPGKRSEVLWRLNNELAEAGMTEDERFTVLRVSKWNKFIGRGEAGDAQLKREIEKATQQKLEQAPEEKVEEQTEYDYLRTTLADVTVRSVSWIWYPYLARRELTILEGDPDLGKSYLIQMVGVHLVDGKKLPTVKAHRLTKGKVAYFDVENDAESVAKRRALDNKCRNFKDYHWEEKWLSIDNEDAMEGVYRSLERTKPVLVVFDTLNAYIGKADTYKASETQQALQEFKEIAKRFNCAVVVIRHLTKNTKVKALYRGQGSIAATGSARVVITVGHHPEEAGVRCMSVTKLNIARKPPALTYTIETIPDKAGLQDRARLVWGDFVDLTSDEIVVASPAKKQRQSEIEDFLREILADGPMKKSAVERAAHARGIGMKTVYEVVNQIGVVKTLSGFGKKKYSSWSLPDTSG